MEKEEIKAIIEALLCLSSEPISLEQMVKVIDEAEKNRIKEALNELITDYNSDNHGIRVVEIAGGFQITSRPQYNRWIKKHFALSSKTKLTLPALETLAIIAYQQPITNPEISAIRGADSTSVLKTLLEKRLIKIKGRKKVVGRPLLYGTSREFLTHFGLKNISELPTLEEFEQIITAEGKKEEKEP